MYRVVHLIRLMVVTPGLTATAVAAATRSAQRDRERHELEQEEEPKHPPIHIDPSRPAVIGASVDVATVRPDGWRRFRDLRLAALSDSPEMFGSTLTREQFFTEGDWRSRAARPASFIAARGATAIGLAGVYEFEAGWCVMGMWIDPLARGSGTFAALMHACESFARGVGALETSLWVMEDNARGRRAYARAGYTLVGPRQHVRDGRHELLMTKSLAASAAGKR